MRNQAESNKISIMLINTFNKTHCTTSYRILSKHLIPFDKIIVLPSVNSPFF